MYKLCRFSLIATAVLLIYSLVFAVGWWVLAAIAVVLFFKRGYRQFTSYGTAKWAGLTDLWGMLDAPRGIILGHIPVKFTADMLFRTSIPARIACKMMFGHKPLVRLPNAVHTAIFAPTAVGKGVSFVIPHFLTCPESTVVVDFKGENAQLTAAFRKKAFGHRIVQLDPFRVVTKNPDSFNPLDFIKADSPLALDDCRDLANALVIRTGQEKEPHWCDAAEMNIAGIISFVVQHAPENDRSLQTVRDILADPQQLEAAIFSMCNSKGWDGMLARLGHQMSHFKDKELASTLTTIGRFLRSLDTLAIAESTKNSSFDPADLLKGKMTIFLVLPPEHMRAQSALLRLWIGSLLRAVVRGGLQEKNKVHFVIDEAASLGHMEAIDDALDKYRGYGIRLQLFYQSVGQLKLCWPEGQDQTLLSNTTQIYFGVNDNETAKNVSERLGERTIVVESGGASSGSSHQTQHWGQNSTTWSRNSNDNWSQLGRRLLKPEEVAALDPRLAITFTPGVPPIMTRLVRYYEKGFLVSRFTRFRQALRILILCLIFFAMALIMAYGITISSGAAGTPDALPQPVWRQP